MPRSPKQTTTLLALSLAAAATLAVVWGLNGSWLVSYLIAINAVTFLAYANDKRAAHKHSPRIPEFTLHLLGFLGGSPAALVAQQLLRHKTLKRSFQLVYWAIVVIQAVALTLYLQY